MSSLYAIRMGLKSSPWRSSIWVPAICAPFSRDFQSTIKVQRVVARNGPSQVLQEGCTLEGPDHARRQRLDDYFYAILSQRLIRSRCQNPMVAHRSVTHVATLIGTAKARRSFLSSVEVDLILISLPSLKTARFMPIP